MLNTNFLGINVVAGWRKDGDCVGIMLIERKQRIQRKVLVGIMLIIGDSFWTKA